MLPPEPPRRCRALIRAACLAILALGSGCSGGLTPIEFERPDTAVPYEVRVTGSPSDDVTSLIEESLSLYRFQDKGAASLAFLRRRAESDVPVVLKILRSRGYYSGKAEVKIEPAKAEGDKAAVTLAVEPGPAYTLLQHRLLVTHEGSIAPPELDAAALGSPVGRQARAAQIAAAETAAIDKLHAMGFPYAKFEDRKGLADPQAATLQVDSTISAGAAFTYGSVTFDGVKTIDEAYLLSYLPWKPGDTFDTEQLRKFQRKLIATNLFSSASVSPPEAEPQGEKSPAPLPVKVTVEEGPRRSVTAGFRYDTDLGPSARFTFEHRNLFGANERLLGETEIGLLEQTAGIGLRKPQYLRPGQDLVTNLKFDRTTQDAYDALTATAFGGLERQVTERWKGGLGLLGEVSRINDSGVKSTAYLGGVPFFAAYDGSDNLLNPTRGQRLRIEVTPFGGVFENRDTEFLVIDTKASAYWPLDRKARYVVAARGRVATILAPGLSDVPATRRLYSGGGGSVRGYAEKFVGPLDAQNNPIGGLSALEAGLELRAKLFGDVGGVIFADAGSVSTHTYPGFEDGVQVAVGLGARYFSPAGPIRVDFAVPVNGRSADSSFQVYFSIGQAF